MKTFKKNNKGFSLVELIVVILIMAIIAVALAPQVMKWVDESRVSADNSNRATIKGAVDAAVADFMGDNHDLGSGDTFYIYEGMISDSAGDTREMASITVGDPVNLVDYIAEVLNNQYLGVEQTENGCFKVDITSTGTVVVTICKEDGTEYSAD